ncbi:unnamed protein product [Meloidogyne enterolobii]|uniref:Uncharacterized protein n=1 Tax=Meloidogyne enterolobii TaxID=390850 RepID=A0ACB0YA39_MELEN
MEIYKFCFYITIFLFALFRPVESPSSPPHNSGDAQISEPSSSTTIKTSEVIVKPKKFERLNQM